MWELLIFGHNTKEPTVTVAKYETEQVCRLEQKRLGKTLGELMENAQGTRDKDGYLWGPTTNCKKIKNK